MDELIKAKLVNRGEIVDAALTAACSGKLRELFEKSPMLMLVVPMIAGEIEKVIFGEKKEE